MPTFAWLLLFSPALPTPQDEPALGTGCCWAGWEVLSVFSNCSCLWGWERVSQTQLFEPRTPGPHSEETGRHMGSSLSCCGPCRGWGLLTCFAITSLSMGGTGCLGARASMELPRASQAPQPGMLFKASEDHSFPQLWTRDEKWGAGKGQPRRAAHFSGGKKVPSQTHNLTSMHMALTSILMVRLRPVGWSKTSGQGTDAVPSGHTDGGILRLAFHMGDQEPERVFTLLQVAVPL